MAGTPTSMVKVGMHVSCPSAWTQAALANKVTTVKNVVMRVLVGANIVRADPNPKREVVVDSLMALLAVVGPVVGAIVGPVVGAPVAVASSGEAVGLPVSVTSHSSGAIVKTPSSSVRGRDGIMTSVVKQ
eukprot:scaffold44333_cov214-Amphora_coffeaeformis.AAC.1